MRRPLVNRKTGEVLKADPTLEDLWAYIDELSVHLEGAEIDLRSKRATIGRLRAELEVLPANYVRMGEVEDIFDEWRRVCGHSKARLTFDRFTAIRKLLDITKPRPYAREHFSLAIAGAAYDPFITTRRNGTQQKHDDCALIFRDGKTFESFIKRAPKRAEGEPHV